MRIFAMISAAILAAGQVQAATFTFNFYNWANGGGDVTGVVRGLEDNATSAATSVEILSNTAGFGLGEYVGTPTENYWTVKNGRILSFGFFVYGRDNDTVKNTSISMSRWLEHGVFYDDVGMTHSDIEVSSTMGPWTRFRFSPELGQVPLPASFSLLAGALVMLRRLERRYRGPSARQDT